MAVPHGAGRPAAGLPEAARLRALVEVARRVNDAAVDEGRLGEVVVRTAAMVGDGATMWLRQPAAPTLSRVAVAHREPRVERRARRFPSTYAGRDGGLVEAVLESELPAVLIDNEVDAYLDEPDPTLLPWHDHPGLAAVAVVPLRCDRGASGVLVVTRDTGQRPFAEADVTFLGALAEMAAQTLSVADILRGSAAVIDETRRQAELVDQVSDVIMAWDVDGRIVNWNAAGERVYRYSAAEALGCDAHALLDTRYLGMGGESLAYDDVAAELARCGVWNGEVRQRRADGEEIEVLCSLTGVPQVEPGTATAIAINHDVTEQRRREALASKDSLTGLPNRGYLADHLVRVLGRWRATGATAAVFFLDLDGFKKVNDTLGHEAGDEVLRATALRLTAALRAGDVVARLGGDEFVAVAEGIDSRVHAEVVARRMIKSAGEPIVLAGKVARVVPSIGVAMLEATPDQADPETVDGLLRRADEAMYAAKRARCGVSFAA